MSRLTRILLAILGVGAVIAPIFVKNPKSTEKLNQVEGGVAGTIEVLQATGVIK